MRTLADHVVAAAIALTASSCAVPQRSASPNEPFTPALEVLMQAAHAHFPYITVLRSAERGNSGALLRLIGFSTHTDAYGSIAHCVVFLQLRKIYGISAFTRVAARATEEERAAAQEEIDAAIGVLERPNV